MIAALDGTHTLGPLEGGVISHLDAQLGSARRLLSSVLAQGAAIRARDVETVLARLADMKAEMARRATLETERTALLSRAALGLGIEPAAVTLEAMTSMMSPAGAGAARDRSSELRGLLAEIAREHGINRVLMRQELAFLDHLVRLLGQEPEAGYRPSGNEQRAPAIHRVLDLQA